MRNDGLNPLSFLKKNGGDSIVFLDEFLAFEKYNKNQQSKIWCGKINEK